MALILKQNKQDIKRCKNLNKKKFILPVRKSILRSSFVYFTRILLFSLINESIVLFKVSNAFWFSTVSIADSSITFVMLLVSAWTQSSTKFVKYFDFSFQLVLILSFNFWILVSEALIWLVNRFKNCARSFSKFF